MRKSWFYLRACRISSVVLPKKNQNNLRTGVCLLFFFSLHSFTIEFLSEQIFADEIRPHDSKCLHSFQDYMLDALLFQLLVAAIYFTHTASDWNFCKTFTIWCGFARDRITELNCAAVRWIRVREEELRLKCLCSTCQENPVERRTMQVKWLGANTVTSVFQIERNCSKTTATN